MDSLAQASPLTRAPRSGRLKGLSVPRQAGDALVRRRELAVGGLAIACAVGAFAIPVSAGTLAHPVGFGALYAWSVLSFVAAGLLWWRARPASRIGPLLCTLAFLLGVQSLMGSANGLGFSVAVLLDAAAIFLAWYLALVFPVSRLDARGRMLMGIATVVVFSFVAKTLLSEEIAGATPLARCTAACPSNQLMLAADPGLAGFFRDIEQWGRIAFSVLLVLLLTSRFQRASRPRRRTVLPVYLTVGLWLIAFSVYNAATHTSASVATLDDIGVGTTVARALFPLGFIAAIVLTRAHAGSALQSMVHELRGGPTLPSVQAAVRHVLDDPAARLAFWDQDRRRYIDANARPIKLPSPNGEVTVHLLRTRRGRARRDGCGRRCGSRRRCSPWRSARTPSRCHVGQHGHAVLGGLGNVDPRHRLQGLAERDRGSAANEPGCRGGPSGRQMVQRSSLAVVAPPSPIGDRFEQSAELSLSHVDAGHRGQPSPKLPSMNHPIGVMHGRVRRTRIGG